MARSEQEVGKHEEELEDLHHFLHAYRLVTGARLSGSDPGPDPPDFVCARRDGTQVAVELTRIIRDYGHSPRSRLRSTWDTSDFMDVDDAVSMMWAAARRKERSIRRTAPEWLSRTILVLQLMEIPGEEVAGCVAYEDFADLGFAEVWAADWTGIEPFGDVELVGLHPPEWRGYHPNSMRGKPYG